MHDFSDVEILLLESGREVRRLFRSALEAMGAGTVHMCPDLGVALELLDDTRPDLLILDLDDDDGAACDAVTRIRQAKIGANPFVVTIGTTWHSSPAKVRGGLDCGVDDLLAKPLSTGDLASRIGHMVESRKRFVSVEGYTGPDRRSFTREDDEVPLVTVPNSLRFKVTGDASVAADPVAVDRARSAMELQRIRRAVAEITGMAGRMERLLATGDPGTVRSMLDRAGWLIERIAVWSAARKQPGCEQIAVSMRDACAALRTAGGLGGDQAELLGLHGQAMMVALADPEAAARPVGSALAQANSILGERGAGIPADAGTSLPTGP